MSTSLHLGHSGRVVKASAWLLIGGAAVVFVAGLTWYLIEDPSDPETAAPGTAAPQTNPPDGGNANGVLEIGSLLPETGNLALLGPSGLAAAQLAVDEINQAGGVLREPVEYRPGDSGDSGSDIAAQTTQHHLDAGVDAIIGAYSSTVSFAVIDEITQAGVILFSPANTAPDFTDYEDNGLYFRTAASDVLQGQALADLIAEDGHRRVGIMARRDPYAEALLGYVTAPLARAGAEVTNGGGIVYDPAQEAFATEAGQIVDADPDALVLIGFQESATVLAALFDAGFTQAAGKDIYLVTSNVGDALGDAFSDRPGILEGIRGTLAAAELSPDLRDRLLEIDPDLEDFAYAPETYDAVVITALAAEAAGTDDALAVAAEINGVTRDGTTCTDFLECRDLLARGRDIDYDGAGGSYAFSDAGEPTVATFSVLQYGPANTIDRNLTSYLIASVEE